MKAPLEYSRGLEKTWIYGALRVRDGKELTRCAASRNSANDIELLKLIEANNPTGDIFMITDNLSSHNRNLQEGWWRLFRRDAFAGQSFANPSEIDLARRVATAQLNTRAKPWVWGRPPATHRHRRRTFYYRI
jgi:hypothetical protein